MRNNGSLFLATLSILGLTPPAFAAPGELDPAFGNNGVLQAGACSIRYAQQSSDGGLLVVGGATGQAVCVQKYDANGQSLDLNFGSNGTVQIPRPATYTSNAVMDVDVMPNGNIAILGAAQKSGDNDVLVVVLTPNGAPDTSFSGDGVLTYSYNTLAAKNDFPKTIIATPDGKLLIGAQSDTSSTSTITYAATLTKLNAAGVFDSSLKGTGKTSFYSGDLKDMVLSPDGSIYGVAQNNGPTTIVKFTPSYALDSTFGTNGRYTLNFGSGVFIWSAKPQADGKLVLAGEKGNNAFIARLNSSGTSPIDTTFGTGTGYMEYDSPRPEDYIAAIAIAPTGEFISTGYSSNISQQATRDVLTLKTDASGNLITSFGVNGFSSYDTAGYYDLPSSLMLQSDEKILIANTGKIASGANTTMVLRYLP